MGGIFLIQITARLAIESPTPWQSPVYTSTMSSSDLPPVEPALRLIRKKTNVIPKVGIILGSGLGALAEGISDSTRISYGSLPGFSTTSVAGHAGELVLGTMNGVPVAVLSGRAHLYEGYSAGRVGWPVRVLAALGAEALILTNASGGIAFDLEPGNVLIINDHIFLPGMMGLSPLRGEQTDERFVSLADAYTPALIEPARKALEAQGLRSRTGVYAMVAGPHYETPAEIRFLRTIGADVVGMSTVPEVILASQLRQAAHTAGGPPVPSVLALSLVTNSHAHGSAVSHSEVRLTANEAGPRLGAAIHSLVADLP